MRAQHLFVVVATALWATTSAQASVEISANPTKNMNCSAGVCAPTDKNAALNATDLANMLASGDVKVVTGSGAVTITVSSSFSWTSTHRLTLDATYNVSFRAPVEVAGQGAVTIVTNDGGSGGDLLFIGKGHLDFWDLSSNLVINDQSFTLVRKLKGLKSAIIANPAGSFALARSYNAKKDRVYGHAPISVFDGIIEGLGNTISNVSVNDKHRHSIVGLISNNYGTIRDLGLADASINVTGNGPGKAGSLVGENAGTIHNCFATGVVTAMARGYLLGGLAGQNDGTISHSSAAVAVGGGDPTGGGLTAVNNGLIEASYATGSVAGSYYLGSLIGWNFGTVSQSFAIGNIGDSLYAGGLIGRNGTAGQSGTQITDVYARGSIGSAFTRVSGGLIGSHAVGPITAAYATGVVTIQQGLTPGGLVGEDFTGAISNSYWDLETSHVSNPDQGAGYPLNDPGITGLTTAQLQSGLPAGFDPAIWAQSPSINDGYPYLINNPPQQ
jgi:hypothetical protein